MPIIESKKIKKYLEKYNIKRSSTKYMNNYEKYLKYKNKYLS